MAKPKLRRVRVEGTLANGVYAKDVILAIINQLGVKGGVGYAYEYAGPVIERMTMEERLTICNMSIEGGARCGYVNPDATTIEYLRGRPYAPRSEEHTSELQSQSNLVCRLLLEKKKTPAPNSLRLAWTPKSS